MQNLKRAMICCSCIILLGAVGVFAEQLDMPAIKAEFQRIDVNKDGFITGEEMQKYQEQRFNDLDKNKDGVLDANELKEDKTGDFAGADKDKDGKVTRQEGVMRFNDYLKALDANKDGRVSQSEYTDYWNTVKAKIKY